MAMGPVYRVRAAARLLSVSPTQIRRWVASGALQAVRVGAVPGDGKATLLFTEQMLEEFLERHATKAKEPEPGIMPDWLAKHERRVRQRRQRLAQQGPQ